MVSTTSPGYLILIVEDEGIIRLGTVEAFQGAGFRVVEAFHVEHALEALTKGAADIHAMFTDVQMPGTMDGIDLAQRASRSWPWIRILVASGRATRLDQLPDKCQFLPKPYDPDHAIGHVRAMLAST